MTFPLLLHLGMRLLPDMGYHWYPSHFWTLPWLIKFSKSHLAKTPLIWNLSLYLRINVFARFIRTVCMRRIRWSCEGLTFVHNEYTGYTLKHLLLRHMYNLPLPMLMCYMLKPYALRLPTGGCSLVKCWLPNALHTVLCGDLYTACVDASRTVFWDHSFSSVGHINV